MKKAHTAVVVAAVAAISMASAQAQTQPNASPKMYAEIGYAALNLKETFGADTAKASPDVLTGVFGYQFLPNMAVEGLVGLGSGKASVKENGVPNGTS